MIGILNEHSRNFVIFIEEKAADIVESINFEAQNKNRDICKAKVNLIDTPNGPEIGVTFE